MLKETIYKHSLAGRYQEYRTKNDYLLDQTSGEARYLFEKRLDKDANAYARKKVATEIISTALVISGLTVLGIELKRGTLRSDAGKIRDFVVSIPSAVQGKWNAVLDDAGVRVAASARGEIGNQIKAELAAIQAYIQSIGRSLFHRGK